MKSFRIFFRQFHFAHAIFPIILFFPFLALAQTPIYWVDFARGDVSKLYFETGERIDIVKGIGSPKGLTYSSSTSRLYWADYGGQRIQSVNLDGSGLSEITPAGIDRPVDVSLDDINGKIYWTDSGDIKRCNFDGSDSETIVVGSRIERLQVDPSEGKVYWANQSADQSVSYIQRANTDGTSVETLYSISGSQIRGIALRITKNDRTNSRIFWTTESNDISIRGIWSSDLDGGNPTRGTYGIPNGDIAYSYFESETVDSRPFWMEADGWQTCKIRGGTATDTGIHSKGCDGGIVHIQELNKIFWVDSGYATSGEQTPPSLRSADINSFGNASNSSNIISTGFNYPQDISITDSENEIFFATLTRQIVKSTPPIPEVQIIQDEIKARYPAIDEQHAKIYFYDRQNQKISRSNFDGSDKEFVIDADLASSVAVDGDSGHIYWFNRGELYRADLDGSDIQTLASNLSFPEHLALDIDNRSAYWSEAFKIRRIDLESLSIVDVFIDLPDKTQAFSLDTPSQKIYWVENRRLFKRGDILAKQIETSLQLPFGSFVSSVAVAHDNCPDDTNKRYPGQCGCGIPDTDSDSDGTLDCNDQCPSDASKVTSGVCGCGIPDTDSDSDGTLDCNDQCIDDPLKVFAGICGCGISDVDTDNDGVSDCVDQCPTDSSKTTAGQCGCGIVETDSDSDGTPNCLDNCRNDPNKTSPGECGCGNTEFGDLNGNSVFECAEEYGTKDQNGRCVPGGSDCYFESLKNSACVGANGFLGQINIASVINHLAVPLSVEVEYFDSNGGLQGTVQTKILSGAKSDFIINEMGLEADTIGNVCVTTQVTQTNGKLVAAPDGAWTGGISIYKPDFRLNNSPAFGEAFDFALYYPFSNPVTGSSTVPLNTYHLGVPASATVANWIAISDAVRDGNPLSGVINYYNDHGALINVSKVFVPDGGRLDFAGHDGLSGSSNRDAVGLAEFLPDSNRSGNARPSYYLTLTRYFYDCLGSSCNNFYTAFNLPNRPATTANLIGGVSTFNDEISIIELNNVTTSQTEVSLKVYDNNGVMSGSQLVTVPTRGTRNIIMNKADTNGYLQNNQTGFASVKPLTGFINGVSIFYKLDEFGTMQYAYAAPMVGTSGQLQLSQFNSFISHKNSLELYNSSLEVIIVDIDFIDYLSNNVFSTKQKVAPKGTVRLEKIALPPDLYGTINIHSNGAGLASRNYVNRDGVYSLPFVGE